MTRANARTISPPVTVKRNRTTLRHRAGIETRRGRSLVVLDGKSVSQAVYCDYILRGDWKPHFTSWADEAKPFRLPRQLPLLVMEDQLPLLVPEDMHIFRHLLRGFAA